MKRAQVAWLVVVSAVVGVVVPVALGSSVSSTAANTIKNGGAELGVAATDASTTVPTIRAWTKTGGFTTVSYAAGGGFPDATVSTAIKGGKNFFAGGPANPNSGATQVVPVTARAGLIDKGKIVAVLSGYLGGYSTQRDSLTVVASFFDAAGLKLGSLRIGPVTPAQRKNLTTMIVRSATKVVPAKTRKVEVRVSATGKDGDYNDGYADNLSLTFAPAT